MTMQCQQRGTSAVSQHLFFNYYRFLVPVQTGPIKSHIAWLQDISKMVPLPDTCPCRKSGRQKPEDSLSSYALEYSAYEAILFIHSGSKYHNI